MCKANKIIDNINLLIEKIFYLYLFNHRDKVIIEYELLYNVSSYM